MSKIICKYPERRPVYGDCCEKLKKICHEDQKEDFEMLIGKSVDVYFKEELTKKSEKK